MSTVFNKLSSSCRESSQTSPAHGDTGGKGLYNLNKDYVPSFFSHSLWLSHPIPSIIFLISTKLGMHLELTMVFLEKFQNFQFHIVDVIVMSNLYSVN